MAVARADPDPQDRAVELTLRRAQIVSSTLCTLTLVAAVAILLLDGPVGVMTGLLAVSGVALVTDIALFVLGRR